MAAGIANVHEVNGYLSIRFRNGCRIGFLVVASACGAESD